MAGFYSLTTVLVLGLFVVVSARNYIITVPKEWLPGASLQVCIQVTNPEAPSGHLVLTISHVETLSSSGIKGQIIFPSTINNVLPPTSQHVAPGEQHVCSSIWTSPVNTKEPQFGFKTDRLTVTGFLGGANVNHSTEIRRNAYKRDTVVQTDKYLYKPGQVVQFRILTHTGPFMNISTEPYPEVYVTTPSRNRIAQWLDVDNSKGLVHLSMQLADELEEGEYTIHVKTTETKTRTTKFKVEEYILPRFEVIVNPPKYVLATDSSFSFTACAKYTFGQPVKGNISWKIDNNEGYGCQAIFTRNNTISGCSEIKVMSAELRMIDCSISDIKATATVSEDGTGVQEMGKGQVSITRRAITFEELRKDDYMKPNLPYTLKVLAKLPDGSPAVGEYLDVCHGEICKNLTTPMDGIVKVYLNNPRSKQVRIQRLVTRAVMYVAEYTTYLKPFFSPSNSSLLIYAPEESLMCVIGEYTNYLLPVLFAATNHTFVTINVQVMSRGQIQYWKSQKYSLTASKLPFENEFMLEDLTPTSGDVVTGVINIPLRLPPTASPNVKVLVWYVRNDGEVVSDLKVLKVEKCLSYSVGLNWSVNETQPGDEATLVLVSEPNSICSLGVVDKSVELLTPGGNTLTIDTLFRNNYYYELNPWYNRQVSDYTYCRNKFETEMLTDREQFEYYTDYVDSLLMFDNSGLYVFSDLTLETRPCKKQEVGSRYIPHRTFSSSPTNGRPASPPRQTFAGAGIIDIRDKNSGHSSNTNAPRTHFPETWLWDLVVLPSSGVSNQDLTLPDTITEWIGKAVCVHPQKGVSLSEAANITTFTPFFIDLTLPPSIKRGEILPVKISVFNYLQQPLPVTVTLENSPEYDILGATPEDQPVSQRMSCLAPQDKQVHTIKIRPNVIGEVNITVSAYVDPQNSQPCGSGPTSIRKRDALVKPITVVAEGFLREKSWSKYICAEEVATGADDLEMTEVSVPSGMVEGSERAWVTAVGDLLAISLQNLGSLIRMPNGCGEQNMLNFAPNIFILKYLKATGQETAESTQKLLSFMNKGYQRQLLYRHDNGSFSAFGKADDSGSTWLTAFVLKSFTQAQPFILIDEESLNKTRKWLIENYGEDRCVASVGKVFNKGMKGGIGERGSRVPLTAYVLISLLESGMNPNDFKIGLGLRCLIPDDSRDPYTLALKAYALAIAGKPQTLTVIQQLLEQAIIAKNSTHWELPKGPWRSNSLAVETAGYAILAMMTWDAASYEQQARKIVKWISAQRNGRGGFYSTQDTVVALQALASYESHLYQGDLDVVAQVQAQDLDYSFSIKDSNKLLQQMVSLPTLPTRVSFNMIGQGCAELQTVLRYNDPEPEASDAFSLRVNSRTEPDRYCTTKRISACAAYLLPDGASNMAVIEVNLVSGYIPEKDDLKKLLKENSGVLKRYEIDGSKVSFYIEEFTAEDVCVNFRVIREVDVENVKPGSVVVYDYYQPEFSISKTYNLPATSQCYYQ